MPNTTVIATVRDVSIESTWELSSLPKGLNSQLIISQLNLNDSSSAAEALSRIQKENVVDHIDVVIANAGICNHWGSIHDMEDSDLMAHFEVNTLGLLRLFRATVPLLKVSQQPTFVYISTTLASIAGLGNSPSLTAAYGVSKVAGNYLIKKIHGEDDTLIAFSIDPGFVQTDMGNRGAQYGGLAEAPVTIAESVEGIIEQIKVSTKSTNSGKFMQFNGGTLPW
ncbi:hypothetical protein N7447_009279 [Penicillium robsamsonii]|uniref:uncharacterized protein n=1 Tax=Penicillium robsamsonii TaxID=1792511 RepID=UPI00254716E8|nr:uncharacterized protein N7447_009279 [Penicillium robsamsonii]KAJ5817046.1 hypothetical protein N7447_009279 [Penicillium robsamsonii]